jgi:hypothetical protein
MAVLNLTNLISSVKYVIRILFFPIHLCSDILGLIKSFFLGIHRKLEALLCSVSWEISKCWAINRFWDLPGFGRLFFC